MTNKKWYEGKLAEQIVSEMSAIAHNCIACAKQGERKESEKLFDQFDKQFKEVIPAIVDMKTEYYAFRFDNKVWDTWHKAQRDLFTIKNGMENQLWEMNL